MHATMLAKHSASESTLGDLSVGRDWEDLLCIFPQPGNVEFGLDSLIEAANISTEDLKMSNEKQKCNVASSWEMILQRTLPGAEAREAIHSLHEVFGIDEKSLKAFNAFRLLQSLWQDERRSDIHEKRADLINVLMETKEADNRNCFIDTNVKSRISEACYTDAQIKVLRENSISIFERLLPLRAVDLKAAIEALFKEDENCKMAAVYVWVSDQSNIAMFWVKKLISQSTVPAESPFLEEMIFTH